MEKLQGFWLAIAIIAAIGAGGVMALQPAVNGRLASQCNHPIQASVISFATGFLALLAVAILLRSGVPSPSRLAALPWWAWGGGILGTYMVTVSLLVAPRLGATRWLALVLAGQITLSLLLDQFGLLGYAQHGINLWRLTGVGLVVVGVWLVMNH